MSENVVITRANGVLEIRLDRPEKKNALTRAMYDAMADAFQLVDSDPTSACRAADRHRRHLHLRQ